MAELSNISSDYDVVKQQITDDLNQSEAFQALSSSSTADILSGMLAGVSALWNHKIEQAALNLFMDTAYGQQTVYSLAKTKGYIPTNKIPAVTNGILDISNIHTEVSIPSGTSFIIGDYQYHTTISYNALASETQLAIKLTQGEKQTYTTSTNGLAFDYFEFSSNFTLTEGSVNAYINNIQWKNLGTSFFGAGPTDQVYTITNNSDGSSVLTLGNNTYGKIPSTGSGLVIEYYTNVGSLANNTTVGLTITSVDGRFNGTTTTTIYGGKEQESVDSIKYTATKLAYTDENTKLITRDNFNGWLYRAYNVLDGRVWGAYETTLSTDPDVTQMNTIWYTVVPPDCSVQSDNLGKGTGSSVTNVVLSQTPVLPGSVTVSTDTLRFKEASGGNGILCEDESLITITGGTAYAKYNPSQADNMFDSNLNAYYDAMHTPTNTDPVIIGYKFPSSTDFKALRIRSVAIQDSTKVASPKTIKIYTTTVASPNFDTDDDWSIAEYVSDLGLILSNTWSRWIGINKGKITAIKLEIESSTTTNDVKIAEIQMQNASQVSTVNYKTGAVVIRSPKPISTSTDIKGTYVLDSIPEEYISQITEDLSSRTLFTTVFKYVTPIVRTIDIYCNVFYSSSYDGSSVKANVTTALNTLFVTPTKMLGSTISLSDIYYTICKVPGVTKVDMINPTYNQIMSTGEFPVLNSLTLNMEIYNV